jgi:hypothetical protein
MPKNRGLMIARAQQSFGACWRGAYVGASTAVIVDPFSHLFYSSSLHYLSHVPGAVSQETTAKLFRRASHIFTSIVSRTCFATPSSISRLPSLAFPMPSFPSVAPDALSASVSIPLSMQARSQVTSTLSLEAPALQQP